MELFNYLLFFRFPLLVFSYTFLYLFFFFFLSPSPLFPTFSLDFIYQLLSRTFLLLLSFSPII